MAYDPENLNLYHTDPTSEAGALAWARKIAQDIHEPEIWTDTEWIAELKLDRLTIDDDAYFRPHVTVSRVVRTNVNYALTEMLLKSSVERETPWAIADRILFNYSTLDHAISAAIEPLVLHDYLPNYNVFRATL